MMERRYLMDDLHPLLQLLLLGSMAVVSTLVFSWLGMYLVRPLFGITRIDEVLQGAIDHPAAVAMNANQINALKFLQFMGSVGAFFLPTIAFAKMKFPDGDFLKLNARSPVLYLILGVLIIFSASPFIDVSYFINQKLTLPSAFSDLEQWMKDSENSGQQLQLAFIQTPRPADLWINLIVMAMLPAIGEELMFRGCVQQVMREWTKNVHVAVWSAAFIFSFIHFEFYGFVPRMLLGGLLGYLFVWSGTLWVPIIAHALYNGIQIVLAYLHDHKMIQFDITAQQLLPVPEIILASFICIALLLLFKRMVDKHRFIY